MRFPTYLGPWSGRPFAQVIGSSFGGYRGPLGPLGGFEVWGSPIHPWVSVKTNLGFFVSFHCRGLDRGITIEEFWICFNTSLSLRQTPQLVGIDILSLMTFLILVRSRAVGFNRQCSNPSTFITLDSEGLMMIILSLWYLRELLGSMHENLFQDVGSVLKLL